MSLLAAFSAMTGILSGYLVRIFVLSSTRFSAKWGCQSVGRIFGVRGVR
jgi:hypothetical protein